MMRKNERDIFDRRTIFKTRRKPCRIAVRADIKKSVDSKKNRPRFGDIWTPTEDQQTRILSVGPGQPRFTHLCQLKTDDSQRSCQLRFPYGTGRSSSNGLLEQMP